MAGGISTIGSEDIKPKLHNHLVSPQVENHKVQIKGESMAKEKVVED